ncbi:MAG: hypothetical protein JWO62_2839 [Acidimicrobiaceae bacterium]|jgi:chitinase|nr:hypothetical protein [Acidimicrobiaceae bacterium]
MPRCGEHRPLKRSERPASRMRCGYASSAMWSSKRLVRAACAAVVLVGAGIGVAAAVGAFGPPALTPAQRAAAAARRELLKQTRVVTSAAALVAAPLPGVRGAAAPATPASLFAVPLPAHAVYGFVPYWELATLTPSDFSATSALAYFGVGVGATGGLIRSGYGWDDLSRPSFASFVSTAHAAGDRVLFTVSTTDPSVVDHLTRSPVATSARLAAQLSAIVVADHLDGVDLDIEGRAAKDRAGFVTFVADLSKALRSSDPTGQIVLDTYPQSAASPDDFFDVARLARHVDTLFVMAYDMGDPSRSSASSPLASPTLGLNDVGSLLDYVKLVPASKLVLGLPLYGYDYTTAGRYPGSPATTTSPVAVTYSSIVAAGRPALWDPGSLTPYSVFERGGQWHQTWFDDPVSLALKVALADTFHLGGVGAWALGQEGTANGMLAALDGGTTPVKLALTNSSG